VPLLALTRDVSPRLAECELTHLSRTGLDVERARAEHRGYERALTELGAVVRRLPPLDDAPDGVFVEDTAVVLDEVAVLARPGAGSRRGEVDSVASALAPLRPLRRLRAPATLDGGDVLRMGRVLYVGRSSRTNAEGRRQLAEMLTEPGYEVREVDLRGCLHLKSAVTALDHRTVLLDPRCVDPLDFSPHAVVETPPEELRAANVLRIGSDILLPRHLPATAERLEARGWSLRRVAMDELTRAEAGVTCCSLLLDVSDAQLPPAGDGGPA
jgi:dimethylargininase